MRSNILCHCSQHLPVHIIPRALKKLDTIFETAASSRTVPNTKNIPQPASVQLAPIQVPNPSTQQFATYSTPVTPIPEPLDNADITSPITISYNESELSPPIPPMFNHRWPSTHQYPTQVAKWTTTSHRLCLQETHSKHVNGTRYVRISHHTIMVITAFCNT